MTLLECIKLSPGHLCHCHGTISLFWRRRFQGVPPNFVSLAEALCHTRLGDLRYKSVVPSHILTLICERFVSLRLLFRYLSFNEPYNAAKSRDFRPAARWIQKDETAIPQTHNHLVNCWRWIIGLSHGIFCDICPDFRSTWDSTTVVPQEMSAFLSLLVWCSEEAENVQCQHQRMCIVKLIQESDE